MWIIAFVFSRNVGRYVQCDEKAFLLSCFLFFCIFSLDKDNQSKYKIYF